MLISVFQNISIYNIKQNIHAAYKEGFLISLLCISNNWEYFSEYFHTHFVMKVLRFQNFLWSVRNTGRKIIYFLVLVGWDVDICTQKITSKQSVW